MSEWQSMESAPKDRCILVWGQPTDMPNTRFLKPGVHAAYWDPIDQSFCLKGADWTGPFIEPVCWQEEPAPPQLALTPSNEPQT